MSYSQISRRTLMKTVGAAAGAALVGATGARAQQHVSPPTVISNPPRDFSQPTTYFTDPDVLSLDPAFDGVTAPNAYIERLWTGGGGMWLEGPAWSSVGRYLLFSDVAGNKQYRWIDDNGQV